MMTLTQSPNPFAAPMRVLGQLFARPQIAIEPIYGTFTTWIGKTNAALAITVRGNQVLAYYCDGDQIAEWFQGELSSNGKLELRSVRQFKLEVQLGGSQASGKVTSAQGQEVSFKASLVPVQGQAGLYRARKSIAGLEYLGGWIVLPNGKQRGAVSCGRSIVSRPVLNLEQPEVKVTSVLSMTAKRLKAFTSKHIPILEPLKPTTASGTWTNPIETMVDVVVETES
jgi:hypothetical protein